MSKKTNKRKVRTFSSKKSQDSCFDFLDQHMANIQAAGDITHWIPNVKTLNVVPYSDEAMSIESSFNYLEYDINFNSEFTSNCWEKKQYKKLIRYLCHELTHNITEEITHKLKFKNKTEPKEIRYYMERVTETTSRWLYGLYLYWMKDWDINISTGESKTLQKLLRENRKKNYR